MQNAPKTQDGKEPVTLAVRALLSKIFTPELRKEFKELKKLHLKTEGYYYVETGLCSLNLAFDYLKEANEENNEALNSIYEA